MKNELRPNDYPAINLRGTQFTASLVLLTH